MPTITSRSISGAFTRYRIMAFTTAVLLIVLVFVGVPLQVWGGDDSVAVVIGVLHGYLFMVYLVTAFDIGIRLRWTEPQNWLRFALVLLAGTVPFAAFFAEKYVHQAYLEKTAVRA